MATSASMDFAMNRDEIVRAAFRQIKVPGRGTTLGADDLANGVQAFNILVKQWKGSTDFAPGLKEWSRARDILIPQYNQASYTLGPAGLGHTDRNLNSIPTKTALNGAQAAAATVMTLDSVTGFVSGQQVGVRLSSGTIHWTTQNGAPSGLTITLLVGIPTAAADDAIVYTFPATARIHVPVRILNVRRRDVDDHETPLTYMLPQNYETWVSPKTTLATPTRYTTYRGRDYMVLSFDTAIEDTSEQYDVMIYREIEDMDSATDNPDYPSEWYRPLVFQLAIDLAPQYSKPVTQELIGLASSSLAIAQNAQPENTDVYFQSET